MSDIKDYILGNQKFNADKEIEIVDISLGEDPLPRKK